MKLIAQGAEAEIYQDNSAIVKKRIKKDYRISEIDLPLRKFRTKREAKVIEKLNLLGIPVPKLLSLDSDNATLQIEKIEGIKLRDKLNSSNFKQLCSSLGKMIAEMHNNDIIHGDLTTSNMIYSSTSDKKSGRIYLIDFGLSFFSQKVEDKAVDIHLLRQALESKHNSIWEKAFEAFMSGYKTKSNNCSEIISRFDKVEERGRNKAKG